MKKDAASWLKFAFIIAILAMGFASCDLNGSGALSRELGTIDQDLAGERKVSKPDSLKPNSLVVSFDPQGGKVSPESKIVKHGPDYGVLPVPTRRGHSFNGWWTEAMGKGILITAESKVKAKENHVLYAAWRELKPERIAGTAVLGTTCIFFEFDVEAPSKSARALVPLSSEGYVDGGRVTFREISYALPFLYVDYNAGIIAGGSVQSEGASFSFQGNYSVSKGFVGTISRTENGVQENGLFVGTPVFAGSTSVNYVGAATYLFPTPTPQTLLFNSIIDFDTNEAAGTWCESGEGWTYSLHGTVAGFHSNGSIDIRASLLPEFRDKMLFDLSVHGQGSFVDSSRNDITGSFEIQYGDMFLPSLLTAAKAPN
jgi:hypothetical protein